MTFKCHVIKTVTMDGKTVKREFSVDLDKILDHEKAGIEEIPDDEILEEVSRRFNR